MVFLNLWFIVVWLVLAIILGIAYKRSWLKKYTRSSRVIIRTAHSSRITRLPEYKHIAQRYRFMTLAVLILFCLALCTSLLLTLRPSEQNIITPSERNRDIMLCLDVSGSMRAVDESLVDTYLRLITSFRGQRVGLDIFNMVGSQVFPLTDDYNLIQEKLVEIKKALSINPQSASSDQFEEYQRFIGGTLLFRSDLPTSNIGLGLAGCVKHLGENTTGRSQSIILATDNEFGGGDPKTQGIITTEQSMMLAKQKNIRVYSLDPGVYNDATRQSDPNEPDTSFKEHETLKLYTIMTSGAYYRLSSVDVIPDVVQKISQQEAKLFVGESQYTTTDTPGPSFIVLAITIICLVLVIRSLKL